MRYVQGLCLLALAVSIRPVSSADEALASYAAKCEVGDKALEKREWDKAAAIEPNANGARFRRG